MDFEAAIFDASLPDRGVDRQIICTYFCQIILIRFCHIPLVHAF